MKSHSIFDQMMNLRFSLWAVKGWITSAKHSLICICTMAIPWIAKNISGLFFHKGIRHRKRAEKVVIYNQNLVCLPIPLGHYDQSTAIVAHAISLRPRIYKIIPNFFIRQ